jgi:hypothetical protein
MAPAHPIVDKLRKVHSHVHRGLQPLLHDLSAQLFDITSGNPVTTDGYVSRLDGWFDKRTAMDGHLCKAQAVDWTTPVPEKCSMSFAEACAEDNICAVLKQLEDELVGVLDLSAPLDDLSPRGRLTIMVRSLLLVVQEGASMIDISDPILLRDLAKGRSPQSMGAQSQAFNRDSMYSCLIKVGILARLALVEGLDLVVVRTIVHLSFHPQSSRNVILHESARIDTSWCFHPLSQDCSTRGGGEQQAGIDSG